MSVAIVTKLHMNLQAVQCICANFGASVINIFKHARLHNIIFMVAILKFKTVDGYKA